MSTLDPFELWRGLRGLVVDGLDDHRRQVAEITGLPFSRVRALRRLTSGALTHAALAEAMMVDRPAARYSRASSMRNVSLCGSARECASSAGTIWASLLSVRISRSFSS